MVEKNREYLKKQIKKNGLWETSDLFGISMAQLLVTSKIEITSSYANDVLLDMIDKKQIPTNYKKFTIEHNGEGGVLWYGSHLTDKFGPELRETIYVMATPLWSGNNEIPIDFDFYDLSLPYKSTTLFSEDNYGEYQKIIDVKEKFESFEKLLEWYRDFYLPTVYDKIMNECLPQVIQNYESEILKSVNEYFN